jgi:hypothetical protein
MVVGAMSCVEIVTGPLAEFGLDEVWSECSLIVEARV